MPLDSPVPWPASWARLCSGPRVCCVSPRNRPVSCRSLADVRLVTPSTNRPPVSETRGRSSSAPERLDSDFLVNFLLPYRPTGPAAPPRDYFLSFCTGGWAALCQQQRGANYMAWWACHLLHPPGGSECAPAECGGQPAYCGCLDQME